MKIVTERRGSDEKDEIGEEVTFPGTRDVSKGEMIHFFRRHVSRFFRAFAPKTGLSNDLDNVSQSVSFHTMSVLFLPPLTVLVLKVGDVLL